MVEQFNAYKWKTFYEHDAGKSGRELAHERLDIVFNELSKSLKNKKDNKKILEIGVSDGYLLKRIKGIGPIVYGMDIAFAMLKLVTKNVTSEDKAIFLTQGTMTNLPFSDNSFDAVTACEVLEHLDEDSFWQAMKELKRVVVPGGSLFITTPYNEQIENSFIKCPGCGYIFPPTGHYSGFNKKKWLSIATELGFSKIDIRKIYGTDFRLKRLSFFTPLIRLAARLFSVDSLTKMFVVIRK